MTRPTPKPAYKPVQITDLTHDIQTGRAYDKAFNASLIRFARMTHVDPKQVDFVMQAVAADLLREVEQSLPDDDMQPIENPVRSLVALATDNETLASMPSDFAVTVIDGMAASLNDLTDNHAAYAPVQNGIATIIAHQTVLQHVPAGVMVDSLCRMGETTRYNPLSYSFVAEVATLERTQRFMGSQGTAKVVNSYIERMADPVNLCQNFDAEGGALQSFVHARYDMTGHACPALPGAMNNFDAEIRARGYDRDVSPQLAAERRSLIAGRANLLKIAGLG